MAIANVQVATKANADATSTIAKTFATTPVAGNTIIVVVWALGGGGSNTWSCADNKGNTYNLAVRKTHTSTNGEIAIFYAENIASSATFTVTCTSSGSMSAGVLSISEWSGLATSSSLDKTTSNSGSSSAPSTGSTGTLAQAAELVIAAWGAFSTFQGGTISVDDGTYTQMVEEQSAGSGLYAPGEADYKIVSATTAQNVSWTWERSNDWLGVIATFKEAAAAAGQPTSKRSGGVPFMGAHGSGFPSVRRWIKRDSGLSVPTWRLPNGIN